VNPHEIARVAYEHHGASQRQNELAQALALVASIAPAVIVEIGCDAGGTLYCWRQLCDRVYGITLVDNSPATGGQQYPLTDHGAVVLRADSHDPLSVAWLIDQLDGCQVDVLHIDGDHSYDGVRADYEMYSPVVRPGGLVLFHDVLNVWDQRVDVPRFWADLTGGVGRVITSRRARPLGFGVFTKEPTAPAPVSVGLGAEES
jgi:cephalosporin hydroxylase